jgi:hypothetical protein
VVKSNLKVVTMEVTLVNIENGLDIGESIGMVLVTIILVKKKYNSNI